MASHNLRKIERLRTAFVLFGLALTLSCQTSKYQIPKQTLLEAKGEKFRRGHHQAIDALQMQLEKDSTDVGALHSMAEIYVMLYIFGLESRDDALPPARQALRRASRMDSISHSSLTMQAIMQFLDWNWQEAGEKFRAAIASNPEDPKARHWYSLWLVSMKGDFVGAMQQSDTIMSLDPSGDYQVGRGSLMYFHRKNESLKKLMQETITRDPTVPWGYDWLGMAHIELKEYDESISIYQKAFLLSDGLVEVGGGLGHALGLAGAYDIAKTMADYYSEAAKTTYLPPVQRAFIHIGIGEVDQATRLLQQAYSERSWFLIFMQVEPWYDPLRDDPRFLQLVEDMQFPVKVSQSNH